LLAAAVRGRGPLPVLGGGATLFLQAQKVRCRRWDGATGSWERCLFCEEECPGMGRASWGRGAAVGAAARVGSATGPWGRCHSFAAFGAGGGPLPVLGGGAHGCRRGPERGGRLGLWGTCIALLRRRAVPWEALLRALLPRCGACSCVRTGSRPTAACSLTPSSAAGSCLAAITPAVAPSAHIVPLAVSSAHAQVIYIPPWEGAVQRAAQAECGRLSEHWWMRRSQRGAVDHGSEERVAIGAFAPVRRGACSRCRPRPIAAWTLPWGTITSSGF
jgi:hypothetical protein